MDAYLKPALYYLRRYLKEPVPTVDTRGLTGRRGGSMMLQSFLLPFWSRVLFVRRFLAQSSFANADSMVDATPAGGERSLLLVLGKMYCPPCSCLNPRNGPPNPNNMIAYLDRARWVS